VVRNRPRTALLVALAASTLALGACGGGGRDDDAGAAAVKARGIPPGITITRTETGPARPAGAGMPPLRTAASAKRECAMFHAGYLAKVYGGISNDMGSVAYWFAQRRAAPGARAVVRRGCRAGLHV
jgi:hypothetical protein